MDHESVKRLRAVLTALAAAAVAVALAVEPLLVVELGRKLCGSSLSSPMYPLADGWGP